MPLSRQVVSQARRQAALILSSKCSSVNSSLISKSNLTRTLSTSTWQHIKTERRGTDDRYSSHHLNFGTDGSQHEDDDIMPLEGSQNKTNLFQGRCSCAEQAKGTECLVWTSHAGAHTGSRRMGQGGVDDDGGDIDDDDDDDSLSRTRASEQWW